MFVHQSEFWTDAEGIRHQIEDMSDEYRRNCCAFLLRWAETHNLQIQLAMIDEGSRCLAFVNGDMAELAIESAMMWECDQVQDNPQDWVRSTPLYQALVLKRPPLLRASNARWRV